MERIKQALEKAKAERDGLGAGRVAGPIVPSKSDGVTNDSTTPPLQESTIAYSRTRVEPPNPALLARNRVINGDGDKTGLTAYKMLRTQVLQRMNAKGWNALAITSPSAGDGKTLTSINLAISLARELHQTVLLVDMDLRNPSIHKYLGLKPGRGILGYLLDGLPMKDVLVNPGIERLVVIPGGEPVENSSEILASAAVGKLVDEMAEFVEEGGVSSPDLLDTLARLGIELKPIADHNIPSYAYFVSLGMDVDNLISQLDIKVP